MKWLLFILTLGLPACGYQPLYGGDRGALRVVIAQNETAQEGLAGPLTLALKRRLQSAGFNVSGSTARTLELRILEVSTEPYNLTSEKGRLAAVDTEVRIDCAYRLINAQNPGAAIEREITVTGLAYAPSDLDAEQAALDTRVVALADELARRITEELVLEDR